MALSDLPLPDGLSVFSCFLVLVLFLVSGSLTGALAAGQVTFSWRANPPEDHVLGYRLYYGTRSRFDSTGHPRPGFHYDSFIDFTESERCDGSDPQSCEALSAGEVVCENLWGDTPRCTVSGLTGPLYVAMTAYNAQMESDYTHELYLPPPPAAASPPVAGGPNLPPSARIPPGTVHMLQEVYSLLLLKK
ncbi:MAG TPA: hypothetical protein ENK27_11660 [Desulfobulbus sp.]|nr:hypothetical protein [Desulfobulbus sp.]